MILVTVNGPMNLGASLLQMVRRGMFLDESHTSDRRHRREALTGGDQPWPWCVPPTWRRVCLALLQVRRHLWTNAWAEGDRDFGFQTGKNWWLVP